MITIQPIVYTADPDAWHRLATDLGLVAGFPPSPDWSEFDGNGVLAIHGAEPSQGYCGTTDLHLLVDDLAAAETDARAAGLDVRHTPLDDVGDLLTITASSITASSTARVTVSRRARPAGGGKVTPEDHAMAVLPIWYQADLDEPRRLLTALGLRPRISSDAGGWHDFTADGGGLVALHRGTEPGVEFALEYAGDLDALAADLADKGYAAALVDEAYNRTIRLTGPDRELWVNGAQTDLYGYRHHD